MNTQNNQAHDNIISEEAIYFPKQGGEKING
jgi:hypothetical protein